MVGAGTSYEGHFSWALSGRTSPHECPGLPLAQEALPKSVPDCDGKTLQMAGMTVPATLGRLATP
jgi:hypothetical protein